MKKAIITTFVILSLGVGLPASQVLAAPESGAQTSQQNVEQGWLEALKTQVALARANGFSRADKESSDGPSPR